MAGPLKARTLALVGLVAFILFMLVRLPAAMVLPGALEGSGFSARAFEGTVWNPRVEGARFGNLRLGEVTLDASPLSLLMGELQADVAFKGPGRQGSFTLLKDGSLHVEALEFVSDVSAAVGPAALGGALRGSKGVFVIGADGRCAEGGISLRSTILEAAFGAEGPMLVGEAVCAAGTINLHMEGEGPSYRLVADGIMSGGKPVLTVTVTPAKGTMLPDDLKLALEFAGLRPVTEGWQGQMTLDIP